MLDSNTHALTDNVKEQKIDIIMILKLLLEVEAASMHAHSCSHVGPLISTTQWLGNVG